MDHQNSESKPDTPFLFFLRRVDGSNYNLSSGTLTFSPRCIEPILMLPTLSWTISIGRMAELEKQIRLMLAIHLGVVATGLPLISLVVSIPLSGAYR